MSVTSLALLPTDLFLEATEGIGRRSLVQLEHEVGLVLDFEDGHAVLDVQIDGRAGPDFLTVACDVLRQAMKDLGYTRLLSVWIMGLDAFRQTTAGDWTFQVEIAP